MSIQLKIKELRESKGFSQEELCENSGISLRTIQRIENGESVPRGSTLKTIASSLNVSPDFLINSSQGEKETNQSSFNEPQSSKKQFPWYTFGFTIIGASSGFLIGVILLVLEVIPDSDTAGMIIIPGAILAGSIGMVLGRYIESRND